MPRDEYKLTQLPSPTADQPKCSGLGIPGFNHEANLVMQDMFAPQPIEVTDGVDPDTVSDAGGAA